MQWIRGALIGKGSFGRVYHAFNVAAGDFIAVKQVDIPKTSSDLLSVQQKETVEALYQEITLLKDLDHEHVVEYLGYDNDETEGVINIFLEYVSGGSISSRLARHGAFEEPVVRHFTRQILLGLEYLHDRKILHRVSEMELTATQRVFSSRANNVDLYQKGYQRRKHSG
jgi:serine/threonine protein kinase